MWFLSVMYELKDYLKAVNQTKELLMDGEDEEWESMLKSFMDIIM